MRSGDAEPLIAAVHEAGRRLLRTWPGPHGGRPTVPTHIKPDGTLVTEADRDSEEILVGALLRVVPDAVVISEEDEDSHHRAAETLWFVDPLDGTRQYLIGSSDFAILVSAWTDGNPCWSIMSFPVDGLMGIADGPAIHIVPNASPLSQRLVHAVYCDPPGLRDRLPAGIEYAIDHFESTRAMFDVASGQAAGAVVLMCGHQAWDVAAPIHLIAASGGIVTDEFGQPVRLRAPSVTARYLVAADQPDLHALLLSALPNLPKPRSQQPQAAETDDAMSTEPFLTPVANDWANRFFDEGFEPTFRALGKYESTRDDLDNLLHLLRLNPGARILDVPCGFGRHAGLLAEAGFSVVGIDLSEHQIALARAKWPEVTFDVRDMRNPPRSEERRQQRRAGGRLVRLGGADLPRPLLPARLVPRVPHTDVLPRTAGGRAGRSGIRRYPHDGRLPRRPTQSGQPDHRHRHRTERQQRRDP